jgi:hypothetical protein
LSEIEPAALICPAAFVLGMVFGATSWITEFCTMGALSDVLFMADWRRFRGWMLALAVAVAGTQGLEATGLIDLGRSAYLSGAISWGGAVLGGLMFGVGMTLAGGCGAKTLVRLGGGNLKSLVVVLVTGLFAMMTLKGLLAPLRLSWERVTALPLAGSGLASPSLPSLLAWTGTPAPRGLAVVLIAGGLAWWCFKDEEFRQSRPHWLGGLIIGLLIPLGWAVSGILGRDPFEPAPLTSFSFAAPMGSTLSYLMTWTGASLTFGIAAVAGTVAGAFAAASLRRELRLEGFSDTADLVRHLTGAALMGTGGVLALGCTIGQGLSGMSTLSLTSSLALMAIIAGGVLGLKRLEEGSFAAVLTTLVRRHGPDVTAAESHHRPPPGTGCCG